MQGNIDSLISLRPTVLSICCPDCRVMPTRSMASKPKYNFWCFDLLKHPNIVANSVCQSCHSWSTCFLFLRPGADTITHTGQQWEDNVCIEDTQPQNCLTSQFLGPPQCSLFCDRHWEDGKRKIQIWGGTDDHDQVNEQWSESLIQEQPIIMVSTRIVSVTLYTDCLCLLASLVWKLLPTDSLSERLFTYMRS